MAAKKPALAPVPPQNLEAEEYVIGAMMLSPYAVEACSEILTGRDFYRESHGRIFQVCVDLYTAGDAVDAITVAEKLEQAGALAEVGGKDRIREIATLVPATSNAAHHARIVRENAIFRTLTIVGDGIARLGWERSAEAQDLIGKAEELVFDLSQSRRRGDFITAEKAGEDAFRRLVDLAEAGRETVGLATGFREVDRMTSGLQPGNLIVIAGRPSMGKTGLALGIAANVAIRLDPPVPVALFTLEMGKIEVMNRLYSMESRVDSERMMSPHRLDREDWGRLADVQRRLQGAPLFIDDTATTTIMEIRSKARRLKLRHPNLGLILVDYIQLMGGTTERFESRNIEVSQISRSLKTLAGELQVPVVAISQLSRDVEKRHDHRPQLSDLRESGAIEQDADLVMFVYREEYYFPEDEEHHGIAEVIVAKQRNGPTGMRKLAFVSKFAKFSDLASDVPFGGAQ